MKPCIKCLSSDLIRDKGLDGRTRCLNCKHTDYSLTWDRRNIEITSDMLTTWGDIVKDLKYDLTRIRSDKEEMEYSLFAEYSKLKQAERLIRKIGELNEHKDGYKLIKDEVSSYKTHTLEAPRG